MDPNEQPAVAFEGEEFKQSERSFEPQAPRMAQWVIRHSGGRIQNGRQANYVLIGFILLAALTTFFLLSGGGGSAGERNAASFTAPSGYKVVYPADAPPRLEHKF